MRIYISFLLDIHTQFVNKTVGMLNWNCCAVCLTLLFLQTDIFGYNLVIGYFKL